MTIAIISFVFGVLGAIIGLGFAGWLLNKVIRPIADSLEAMGRKR